MYVLIIATLQPFKNIYEKKLMQKINNMTVPTNPSTTITKVDELFYITLAYNFILDQDEKTRRRVGIGIHIN
jgi:hypothetical protein